jgi:hypothetical protein
VTRPPVLIRKSELTGRWYAITRYRTQGDTIIALRKYDVTDQVEAALKADRQWRQRT